MKIALKIAIVVTVAFLLGLGGIYYLFPNVTANFLIEAERKASGLSQYRIEVEGARIEYLAGGNGDPLILLHGFGADKDNWTRIAKYLAPHVRIIAPDLPGFGETDLPRDNDFTIHSQVEWVRAFIQALGIKSHHLGGSSMGGAIAGAYASRYPNNLMSLVLFAPAGIATSTPSEMFQLIEKGQAIPLIAQNSRDYEHLLDFVFVKRPFIPSPVKKVLAKKAISRHSFYQKIFKQLVDTPAIPLEDLITGLPVPSLIIWGDQDRVLHVSGANILGAVIPKAQVEIIRAAGHLPMIERQKETAEIYLNFLGLQ